MSTSVEWADSMGMKPVGSALRTSAARPALKEPRWLCAPTSRWVCLFVLPVWSCNQNAMSLPKYVYRPEQAEAAMFLRGASVFVGKREHEVGRRPASANRQPAAVHNDFLSVMDTPVCNDAGPLRASMRGPDEKIIGS
jgi:hypothetical protein